MILLYIGRRLIYEMAPAAMFIIELVYTADLEQIDAHMRAHVVFLKKHYASGHFLLSGRKVPREGGVIIALGQGREQIEAIMREDPFVQHGLAEFRVIEFRASQRADDIQARIDAEPRPELPSRSPRAKGRSAH